MKVFGITGGVGAGKSEVLTYLGQNYDATVIQADEAGYLVMLPGISTHALTEGDNAKEKRGVELRRFQLTPSRRATPLPGLIYTRTNFNSRPHGGRQSTTTRTPY